MEKKMKLIVRFANLPREICHIAIGKDHVLWHRMTAGAVIMAGGVSLAKYGGHFPADAVMHYLLDIIGYFVHALGAVPYLEWLIEEDL